MLFFPVDEEQAEKIDKAIKILHNVTCVRFVNHTNELDFVTITGDSNHCSSKVGRLGYGRKAQIV